MLGRSSRDIAATAEITVESTMEIPFTADANTTVRDIRRMKNGEAFLNGLVEVSPLLALQNGDPKPGSTEYIKQRSIPEMVLRQVRLMGAMPGTSIEDVQKLIDDKLNR